MPAPSSSVAAARGIHEDNLALKRALLAVAVPAALAVLSLSVAGCKTKERSVANFAYVRPSSGAELPQVWLHHEGGGEPHSVPGLQGFPALSPNGRRIVLEDCTDGLLSCDLSVSDVRSAKPRRVVDDVTEFTWLADSVRLIALANGSLVSLNVLSDEQTTLVRGDVQQFSVSSDGKFVAFARATSASGGSDIFIMRLGVSGQVARLTQDGLSHTPLFAGRSVLFVRDTVNSTQAFADQHLWIISGDGVTKKKLGYLQLPRVEGALLAPVASSANGARVLLRVQYGSVAHPYVVDVRRRTARRIATGPYSDVVDISEDGTQVLLVRNGLDWTPPPSIEIRAVDGSSVEIMAYRAEAPSWTR
jgi:dipeptidyl aminopeptidase/acylaminoacyl peptidase